MTSYQEFENVMKNCTLCALHESRTNVVVGDGPVPAKLMIIGEGPGAEEDKQGKPFVGRSGQLLTEMLDAIDIPREEVFIGNIVKCRPPNNRAPKTEEVTACMPYILEQVERVNPDVILLLGATALQTYIDDSLRITQQRGIWMKHNDRDVIATFHPAALLRDPNKKPLSFEDMLQIKRYFTKKQK